MPSSLDKGDQISVALVTGQHPFDVPGLHGAFRSLSNVDFYPQHIEDFTADAGQVRTEYDVVVFYHFNQATPGTEPGWWNEQMKTALEALGETNQGLLILHHAILAFLEWPFWQDVVGLTGTGFDYHIGETLRIDVSAPDHPITNGLESWEMVDETYEMADPTADCEILLTTDSPKSSRAIAWTRQYRNARVFCLQSGHDNETFTVPQFRTVLGRGIEWCAGRV